MPAPYKYLIVPESDFPIATNSEEIVEKYKVFEYDIIVDMETGSWWNGILGEWRYPSQV